MKYAIIQFGWKTSFVVEVKKLSAFLEMLGNCPLIEDRYVGNERVFVLENDRSPTITLTDTYPMTHERYSEMTTTPKEVPHELEA